MRLSRLTICCAAAAVAGGCSASPTAPLDRSTASVRRSDTSPQPLDCTKYAMAGGRLCEDPTQP